MAGRIGTISVVAMSLATLVACSDTTGPAGQGQVRVYFSRGTADSGAAAATILSAADGPLGRVPLSAVESITISVTSVDAIKDGSDGETAGGFTSLDVTGAGDLDLMALPTDEASAIQLASGTLDAGTYSHIRLRYDPASVMITLNTSVDVGNATFDADVAYPLIISGGEQSGIKVQVANFVVPDGGAESVNLFFDADTSVGTVVATGNGVLRMNSVMHAQMNNGAGPMP